MTSRMKNDAKRVFALTFLLLSVLGEAAHLIVVLVNHHAMRPSNVMQFVIALLALFVSVQQRLTAKDALQQRCWSAMSIAFAIWTAAQGLFLHYLHHAALYMCGVRLDDLLWLLFGLPILLAVNTTHEDGDRVLWFDRGQAIFFIAVLYLMVFMHLDGMTVYHAFGVQNVALVLSCLLRLPTCTTSPERRFFLALTSFLVSYGAFESCINVFYSRGWLSGGPVDLVWTLPFFIFIVLVETEALVAVPRPGPAGRWFTAVRHMKGLSIAALTFMTMGISALLALHRPWLGGTCVAVCFVLFALRTSSREHTWDEAHRRLKQTVLQDALTGLGNRLQLRDALKTSLGHHDKGEYPALLFVDLDRFKAINDSLGHAVGDALLIQVAKRLRQAAPSPSLVCRIGGDEFVVLAFVNQASAAELLGADLLEAMQSPFDLRSHSLRCTASIGVVLAENGEDIDDLIRTADLAMYRAKQLGKNRVQLFDAHVLEKINSRWRLESDLRLLIERNGIDLAFQPIVSVQDGSIDGFEALARWQHPEHGQVPPSDFIPLAEDTGLILKLGAQLLEAACTRVAGWNIAWKTAYSISVNVSPRQLTEHGFVSQVLATLCRAGLSPHLLRLEITESALLVHEDTVHQVLAELREHGIRISLDDFGTGYSSLSFLLKLPVDEIKIDRSFVSDMHRDPQRRALVETVVQLGRSLGKRVVGEGVETEYELAALASLGCECAQGWFISRPLAADVLEANMDAITARSFRGVNRTAPPTPLTIELPVRASVGSYRQSHLQAESALLHTATT